AILGALLPLDQLTRLQTIDDLGDVRGVASELYGELAHPPPRGQAAEHASLSDAQPVLIGGCFVRTVVGVHEVEHRLLDIRPYGYRSRRDRHVASLRNILTTSSKSLDL